MAARIGQHTIRLTHPPCVIAHAGLAGKKEKDGPLGNSFDQTFDDVTFGVPSWEEAEQTLLRTAMELAAKKADLPLSKLDLILAGDLQNQCTASSFAFAGSGVPSKNSVPESGASRPLMSRSSVLLPLPDSPTMPRISPSASAKLTPSSACTAEPWTV